MATIKKREGRNGVSYLIRASCGYDVSGRQVIRSMTWKPADGMTARQIKKELNRQAVLFDETCATVGAGNGNIKFEAFARQWFHEYAQPNLRARSVARLHELEPRTYAALGHIRIDKLTARQIQGFINDLGAEGVSKRRNTVTPKEAFALPPGVTQKTLSERSGVSRTTISSLCRGGSVSLKTAEKIAKALDKDVRSLFDLHKDDGKLAVKTVKHYLSFVPSVLDYAFRFGMIRENPCRRVILPKGTKAEQACYTVEEAQRFLESLENEPTKYRAFFVLAIYAGLRRGELLGLRWDDIDFENRMIRIRRTSLYLKERGTFEDDTKTEKSRRTLKLPDCVFSVLHQHREAQAQERLMLGDRWQDTGYLFTGQEGAPMHPNTPYHWLMNFCDRTGQRFLGIHAFRHLNASLLISSGADVKTVSSSLGHSNVSTTLNIYAHTFEEAQARAADAVANILAAKLA